METSEGLQSCSVRHLVRWIIAAVRRLRDGEFPRQDLRDYDARRAAVEPGACEHLGGDFGGAPHESSPPAWTKAWVTGPLKRAQPIWVLPLVAGASHIIKLNADASSGPHGTIALNVHTGHLDAT